MFTLYLIPSLHEDLKALPVCATVYEHIRVTFLKHALDVSLFLFQLCKIRNIGLRLEDLVTVVLNTVCIVVDKQSLVLRVGHGRVIVMFVPWPLCCANLLRVYQ